MAESSRELVIGQINGSSKPWPVNVNLRLLVGLVVVGGHPKREKKLEIYLSSKVYLGLRKRVISIV